MKRDLAKDRERLREYDEKGSMAALGFAHGAIEHYFDRTETAEKQANQLMYERDKAQRQADEFREALCSVVACSVCPMEGKCC
jgi:hypothetical protein